MYNCIVCTKERTAKIIRLNMPETGNRIGLQAVSEIQQAIREANEDEEVGAIILTGTGEFFCAGGAIDGFPDGYAMDQRDYSDGTVEFQKALYQSGKPMIAAVNGKAFAGGLTIVEGCDLAVASEEAQFGLSELSHGNFPMIALAVNGKWIPKKRLFEMIYLSEPIDAKTAESWNMVNRVVPKDEVLAEAVRMAEIIGTKSRVAMKVGRQTYYDMVDMPLSSAMVHAKAALLGLLAMEDVIESEHAKRENREPEWIGK
ncbi:enoyl-CoA hydratase/isomerase family protein [Clostridium sp. AM58-1XD]|uniref:enoyl-CoA hydratase/isomerase family protein n=1 Tax=Clostridium sp. AM58-1XD TaxID=2292307 RepID=UPI000E4F9C5F|nr:enoyl-CoA hydratase/isomerase family protein [Clostridium sp. AM58-1XD]RGZ01213.1 enoyl-CoA hydratase/isomerase family protein [Clostridium sp. AM58-1XD]